MAVPFRNVEGLRKWDAVCSIPVLRNSRCTPMPNARRTNAKSRKFLRVTENPS